MIKFRQKAYTIKEGSYTGPKDLEKIPGTLGVLAKSTLVGVGVGALAGKLISDDMSGGAKKGAAAGLLGGILFKMLLNRLHTPMPNVKFQEVDKAIRREFGVYRVSGVTLGENKEKIKRIEDAFTYNDQNVTAYKINVSIQNGRITMYTLGLSDTELDYVSRALDMGCKKYLGMDYQAKVLDSKSNSYAVNIVFTNYDCIAEYLVDVAELLHCKINLLDGRVDVSGKLSEYGEAVEEEIEEVGKNFSFKVAGFDKYELLRIFTKGAAKVGLPKAISLGPGYAISGAIIGAIQEGLDIMTGAEKAKTLGATTERQNYTNRYLGSAMNRLGYAEGVQYTVGKKGCPLNMSLIAGQFIVCVAGGTKEQKELEKVWSGLGMSRTEVSGGRATLYTYQMKSRREFDIVLQKLFGKGLLVPNIYEG